MKIVVLDAHTLNPGDLSWAPLEELGECEFYDRTPSELIVERASGADAVLTNKVPMRRETIQAIPTLKYIGVTATGYNVVDVDAAREHEIDVCNAPSYGSESVAQMAMAHILNLAQRIAHHSDEARAGQWANADDWCFWDFPMMELRGRTLGIVGLGEIGSTVAKLGVAFGMRVLAFTRTPKNIEGVACVDLDSLLRESDVVSLHCPLTPDTEKLIDRGAIETMKPTAVLINTGRGQLVDSQALADALNADRLAGAGIDTLEQEPPPADHPLLSAKNCYVTPHIAWATQAARSRLLQITLDNVRAFIDGNPQNVVN